MDKNQLLNDRNFITPQELHEVFDGLTGMQTIRNLIKTGEIPSVKLNHRNLIPTSYVKKLLEKGAC